MSIDVRKGANVIGCHIDSLYWEDVISKIYQWGQDHKSKYIVLCNVHSVVTGLLDQNHLNNLNSADMATSDGMPVTWALRKLGFSNQQRINGPDLMWKCCENAEKNGQKIFFYGSTNEVLATLESRLRVSFPSLQIVGIYSPPFRPLTEAEDAKVVERLNASGAHLIFVGLGCPLQENWMFVHRGKVNAVMLGVGAAFNYHAGEIKRAPQWMQNVGFEWLHRLANDPRRLWKRYLITNFIFIFAISAQFLGVKKFQ